MILFLTLSAPVMQRPHHPCEQFRDVSPCLVVEIGGRICIHRNMEPSELMNGYSDTKIIKEIRAALEEANK